MTISTIDPIFYEEEKEPRDNVFNDEHTLNKINTPIDDDISIIIQNFQQVQKMNALFNRANLLFIQLHANLIKTLNFS